MQEKHLIIILPLGFIKYRPMKKVREIEEREIMSSEVRKVVVSPLYTYIRDLVIAAMIGGLILNSIRNSEKIGIIEERVTNHVTWGASEGRDISRKLQAIEERLDKMEIKIVELQKDVQNN